MPLEQTVRPHASSQAEIQEAERLEALDRLDAIDAPHDDAFDGIARLVKNVFDVPIAIVSNVLRITATGLVYVATADKATHDFMHDLLGWLMMPVGLALLALEVWALKRLVVDDAGA